MASGHRMLEFKYMLKRYEILPKLVPAKEEQWIYRAENFIERAPIGSVIRNSWLPAPLHYIQLFLLPQFLWMLDIRDWVRIFSVWSTLLMAIGIDPFVEDQPLEGLTFGNELKRWGPALRGTVLWSHSQWTFHRSRPGSSGGFSCVPAFLYDHATRCLGV